MFRSFNLNINEDTLDHSSLSELEAIGLSIQQQDKQSIEERIESFRKPSGELDAKKITANWFPQIQSHVFLSHSHKDEKLVTALSGWLHSEFGLNSFVDSLVWGYSDKLLRMIDNEYCMMESKEHYIYEKRNLSTAHVHMMLSVALSEMINNCECIIFVNTPNSISISDALDRNSTHSPWIYAEIMMTRLVQKRSTESHRSITANLKEAIEKMDSLKVSYDIPLGHLSMIEVDDLLKWKNECQKKSLKENAALDELYRLI